MKLFTVGPVEMYPNTLDIAGRQLPYFRTEEFSKIMLDIQNDLKALMHAHSDSKAVVLTGSGSAAMEAVVCDAFDEHDCLLIVNGGTFGARFVRLAQIHHIPYDEIILPFPEELTMQQLEVYKDKQYTALLVNIHETSTGQFYDIEMLSKYAHKHHMRLIIDAISSFLADPYDMEKYDIDCTIISSQKALALSPGISMIVMKEDFYKNYIENKPIKNLYLSIQEHVENMERGQTPNTPAVGIILELHDRLRQIQNEKIMNTLTATREKAMYFRKLVQKLPIKIPTYPLSNALTPLFFPNNEAQKVYHYLKDTYGIYVTPNGGTLSDILLRVGHLGNLQLQDYDELILRLQEVLS